MEGNSSSTAGVSAENLFTSSLLRLTAITSVGILIPAGSGLPATTKNYSEGSEKLAQVAQRGHGFSIPGNIQSQGGWVSEQPGLFEAGPAYHKLLDQMPLKIHSNPNYCMTILCFAEVKSLIVVRVVIIIVAKTSGVQHTVKHVINYF